MKIRMGFVSNSSSSSFLIKEDKKYNVIQHGYCLFDIDELIKRLENMTLKEMIDNEYNYEGLPEFMNYSSYIELPSLLEKLQSTREDYKKEKSLYITELIDRDHAYEYYPLLLSTVFMGDL